MTEFTDFGLVAPILQALTEEGYTIPTPIQAQAIPHVLTGRDLLGIAQTGTGKTAAFALPILHKLATDRKPAPRRGTRVLVLSPTRELASQIAESFRTYGKHLNLAIAVVYGGVPHGPQIKALARGLDVLVATPGRLVDHLDARMATLADVEFLVLDEVDQMLDLGFFKAIRRIVRDIPSKRQNLFFSATMPEEIGKLAGDLLVDPIKVSVAPVATTVERVTQQVYLVEGSRKRDLLVELLADKSMERTIVFTRTKRGADKVTAHLEVSGIPTCAIHGNKSQAQRERALQAFRNGQVRALVATDIAARGIDISGVTHVVNYELPEVPENYVHRIGRTARAGAEGIAISFCGGEERDMLRGIEKLTRLRLPTIDRRTAGAQDMPEEAPRSRQNHNQQQQRSQASRGGEQRSYDPNRQNRHPGGHAPRPHHVREEQTQHAARRHTQSGERPVAAGNGGAENLARVGFMAQPQARPGQAPYRRPRPAGTPRG